MSPTIFKADGFRFFFFSREERRIHVHVSSGEGEAKFLMDPRIELARSYGIKDDSISRIIELIKEHEVEIRDAWDRHFTS
jgi:hypothetical protein